MNDLEGDAGGQHHHRCPKATERPTENHDECGSKQHVEGLVDAERVGSHHPLGLHQ